MGSMADKTAKEKIDEAMLIAPKRSVKDGHVVETHDSEKLAKAEQIFEEQADEKKRLPVSRLILVLNNIPDVGARSV